MIEQEVERVIRRTIESLRSYATDLERNLEKAQRAESDEPIWRIITALMAIPSLYRPEIIAKLVVQACVLKGEDE